MKMRLQKKLYLKENSKKKTCFFAASLYSLRLNFFFFGFSSRTTRTLSSIENEEKKNKNKDKRHVSTVFVSHFSNVTISFHSFKLIKNFKLIISFIHRNQQTIIQQTLLTIFIYFSSTRFTWI